MEEGLVPRSHPGSQRWFWVMLYAPWAFLVVYPWLVLSTMLGAIGGFLVSLLRADFAFYFAGPWAKGLILANFSRVTITGFDKVQPGHAYVMVSNHQSHFDILALLSRWPHQFRFVMKQELRSVPFLGWYCGFLGNVFVDRRDHARSVASIKAAIPLLERGVSVLFFAEGTRSRDGRLQAFKKGAFNFALESGFPILPISISGTHRILPGNQLGPLPGHVRMTVHEPIPTAGLGIDQKEALMQQVRTAISSGLTPFELR